MSVIHDVELFTVGPDEVVVTFRTELPVAVTTVVGDHEVVTEGVFHTARAVGLEPGAEYTLHVEGATPTELLPDRVTTLARPAGRLLARFGTANDVHFGEEVCGLLGDGEQLGPVFAAEPGAPPYPEVMNGGAIDEMLAADLDAVMVKGDLTDVGSEEQYEAFRAAYGRLGPRMHHVRGNHDAMITETIAPEPFSVDLEGVRLVVLDTVRPGTDKGRITPDQLEMLDALAGEASTPVLVFGHHHTWDPGSDDRNDHYFGINPDDTEALLDVFDRHESIAGYFAGHTHRNRVRHFERARGIPQVEVACVKDYPGVWAEYRVYEGGYVQLARRIARPDARAWTEQTRHMFQSLYRDYALGSVADRCFTRTF